MAKRRPNRDKPQSRQPARPAGRSASALRARKAAGEEAWELVHPRCALDRQDDVEEVRKMVEADEIDVAIDELRWLLNGCSDFIDAHKLLGELALLDNDLPLARGHFGYAYRLGTKAMEQAGAKGPLPYRLPSNQSFHQAGKGLAYCLKQLGKDDLLREVVDQLLRYDPTDPLGVRGFCSERS